VAVARGGQRPKPLQCVKLSAEGKRLTIARTDWSGIRYRDTQVEISQPGRDSGFADKLRDIVPESIDDTLSSRRPGRCAVRGRIRFKIYTQSVEGFRGAGMRGTDFEWRGGSQQLMGRRFSRRRRSRGIVQWSVAECKGSESAS